MTVLPTNTPYYGGKQVPFPSNVTSGPGAPPSIATTDFIVGQSQYLNTTTGQFFVLTSKAGGVNSWAFLGGSSGDLNTLTGDSGGAISPNSGNIQALGTANQITVTGTGAQNKLVWSLPATITTPGSLQATTTLTAGTGVTATTGGVTASAGDISATLGNITAAAGNVAATLGSVSAGTTVTAGTGVTATSGGVTATAGDITATAGDIIATAGDITASAGNIDATLGSLSAGTTVTAGTGVTATAGGVTATAGDITATANDIVATAGDIYATAGDIYATAGDIYTTAGAITSATSLTATLGDITATNGNLVLTAAGNKINHTSVATLAAAGANSMGSVVLVGGTVTVSTTAVTANSLIKLWRQSVGATGAAALGQLSVGTIVAATSFDINAWSAADATALQASDVSVIGWEIIN